MKKNRNLSTQETDEQWRFSVKLSLLANLLNLSESEVMHIIMELHDENKVKGKIQQIGDGLEFQSVKRK